MRAHVLRRSGGVALACLALWLMAAVPVFAQEYVIGAEDVLQISVWTHPELEKSVTVSSGGSITYPPIGDFKVVGLTPAQLAARLGDRLSTYLRQTTTVTVTVTQYMSRSVTVSGAVAKPGRYGFEKMPGLVDVISQAGGAIPGADLAQVQVVRRDGVTRRTLIADVAAVLREGDTSKLPALAPGDMVIVPAIAGAGAVAPGEAAAVLGQVNKPGLYPVAAGLDVWTLLAAAGGITATADLANVRVVSTSPAGPVTVSMVNLRDVLRHGAPAPTVIKPGDVVFISATGSSTLGRSWAGLTSFLGVSRDLLNIAVLVDILRRPTN